MRFYGLTAQLSLFARLLHGRKETVTLLRADVSTLSAKLVGFRRLVAQVDQCFFSEFFGCIKGLLLKLGAREFLPAARASEGEIAFDLAFSRMNELLAAAYGHLKLMVALMANPLLKVSGCKSLDFTGSGLAAYIGFNPREASHA